MFIHTIEIFQTFTNLPAFLFVICIFSPFVCAQNAKINIHWNELFILNNRYRGLTKREPLVVRNRSLQLAATRYSQPLVVRTARLGAGFFESWYMYWWRDLGKRLLPLSFCIWGLSFQTNLFNCEADPLKLIWLWTVNTFSDRSIEMKLSVPLGNYGTPYNQPMDRHEGSPGSFTSNTFYEKNILYNHA